MPRNRDPYMVLGLDRTAGPDEIKSAYRGLAKQYHPDIAQNGANTEALFQDLNAAYDILGDPGKRTQFDRGEIDADGIKARQERHRAHPRQSRERTQADAQRARAAENFRSEDPWARRPEPDSQPETQNERAKNTDKPKSKSEPWFDFGKDWLRDKPVNARKNRREPTAKAFEEDTPHPTEKNRASDRNRAAEENRTSAEKRKKTEKSDDVLSDFFSSFKSMPKDEEPVSTAGEDLNYKLDITFEEAARGVTKRVKMPGSRKLDVKIPAGVGDGQQIRLKGQGNDGFNGGGTGDALVEIAVKHHDYFSREGDDVHLTLPITVDEAVLGAKVVVPTLDGPVTMTIPIGSNTDTVFRLKGKGLPKAAEGLAKPLGDQYVTLKVVLPPQNNDQFAKLIRKWAAKNPYDVRSELGLN